MHSIGFFYIYILYNVLKREKRICFYIFPISYEASKIRKNPGINVVVINVSTTNVIPKISFLIINSRLSRKNVTNAVFTYGTQNVIQKQVGENGVYETWGKFKR
jgi:hypothetical protein